MSNLIISVTTFKSNGKTGLINSKGEIIAESIYDAIGPFQGAFARVRLGEKFGLIDKQGKLITKRYYNRIDARFWGSESQIIYIVHCGTKKGFYLDGCEEFSGLLYNSIGGLYNDRALVSVRGLYGYINGKGEVVIPPLFSFGTDFEQNIATVTTDNKVQYIDLNGNEVTIPDARFLWRNLKQQTLVHYISRNHFKIYEISNPRNLCRTDFASESAWQLYSELTPHTLSLGTIDGYIFLFDKNRRLVSPFYTRQILMITHDRFIVSEGCLVRDQYYSLYTVEGQKLLPAVFKEMIHLKDDIYIIRIEEEYGLVKEDGKFIGECNYNCPQDIPEILEII